LERAAASARKALELWRAVGDVPGTCIGLELCAVVLTAPGQAEGGRAEREERAAQLLGAAAAERDRTGWRRRPISAAMRDDIAAAAAEAQATLGAERWATAYTSGRALSREEAYAEALKVSQYSAILPNVQQPIAMPRK
jgi:phage I-like protein